MRIPYWLAVTLLLLGAYLPKMMYDIGFTDGQNKEAVACLAPQVEEFVANAQAAAETKERSFPDPKKDEATLIIFKKVEEPKADPLHYVPVTIQ